MTQEEKDRLRYQISVMQAALEDEEIECTRIDIIGDEWSFTHTPLWDWRKCDYRVKPEPPQPKYRPFKNAEEVMEAIKEHGDWVILSNNSIAKVIYADNNIVKIGNNTSLIYNDSRTWAQIDFIKFADGTPFGKLIEE